MLRLIYSALLYLAVPFILLRLLWRSRKMPAYRQRWLERFAYFTIPPQKQNGIWLHAVSLGEFIAAIPILKMLLQRYPHLPITITSMTITGSHRIQQELGNQVFHVYVPYDLPTVVTRFLTKVKPKIAIILETELWPNILYYCHQRHIPVMLANARLSERSMRGYQFFANGTKGMLQNITILAAHAKADAQRFVQLGLPEDRVHVTGSIKFETHNPPSIFEQANVLRRDFGQRLVWIAASTHEGEETKILAAHQKILQSFPEALLILVPRHPERFAMVKELVRKQGYSCVTRSSNHSCTADTQIYFGDTMGELKLFYAASDVAFVGGSFVPVGGHNILEPIGLHIATITGPQMFNFSEITEILLAADALVQIQNEQQLTEQVLNLFRDPVRRAALRDNGETVLKQNRGALEKNIGLIAQLLENKKGE